MAGSLVSGKHDLYILILCGWMGEIMASNYPPGVSGNEFQITGLCACWNYYANTCNNINCANYEEGDKE
jgi:hypothetical protein